MSFSAQSTTDDVLAGVDLAGVHAVVTGAAGGLGAETARALAVAGASVTMAGRNQANLELAAADIRTAHPEAELQTVIFDLASLNSINGAVRELHVRDQAIDLLINNAAIMNCPFSPTADGFEMQFGTNHLGHFALTAGVADLLSDRARVIAVASAAHLRAPCDLDDLNWSIRDYNKILAYAHSKTANIWFASALARRWANTSKMAFSLHPGVITTNLSRYTTDADRQNSAGASLPPPTRKTIAQGAATSVWAATASDLSNRSGTYLVDCGIAPPKGEVSDPRRGCTDWTYDLESEDRLWQASSELTRVTF